MERWNMDQIVKDARANGENGFIGYGTGDNIYSPSCAESNPDCSQEWKDYHQRIADHNEWLADWYREFQSEHCKDGSSDDLQESTKEEWCGLHAWSNEPNVSKL